MTGDYDLMKLTFLPQCRHSCRMETFLGPLEFCQDTDFGAHFSYLVPDGIITTGHSRPLAA